MLVHLFLWLMQHRDGIRVEICMLSSALVVKILVTLLGIVPRSSVTTARNKVISSLLVLFDLKGSRVLLIMPPSVPLVLLNCLLPRRLFIFLLLQSSQTRTHSLLKWYNKWSFLLLGSQAIIQFLLSHGVLTLELLTIWWIPFFSLSNVKNYDGNLKINTTDGSSLPISVVDDLSSSLTDVFVSLNLSTNLISIGQLVDNNCNVNFSCFGCVVQDQVLEKMIAKGPKVGWLFPLHVFPSPIIPSFHLLSFACNVVGSGHKMWHRCLGHPNSDVLRSLFNSGLLGNKTCSSLDLSFDCTSCKLGKSKVLPFPHSASHASQCFDIIHSDVWGIAPIVSYAHYKYFVTFIDDFSCFTWVYFL